jgi:hypothetical protein
VAKRDKTPSVGRLRVKTQVAFISFLALPYLRGWVVHLINTDMSCGVGIPESERVESGAEDYHLPKTSCDSF